MKLIDLKKISELDKELKKVLTFEKSFNEHIATSRLYVMFVSHKNNTIEVPVSCIDLYMELLQEIISRETEKIEKELKKLGVVVSEVIFTAKPPKTNCEDFGDYQIDTIRELYTLIENLEIPELDKSELIDLANNLLLAHYEKYISKSQGVEK